MLAPGRELRRGRGVGAGAPRPFSRSFVHSFFHSLMRSVVPATGVRRSVRTRCAGGPPGRVEAGQTDAPMQRTGGGQTDILTGEAVLTHRAAGIGVPARSPRVGAAGGGVWTVGPPAGLADLDPHKPRIPAVRPSRGHSPRALPLSSPLSDPPLPRFIHPPLPCPPCASFSPAGLGPTSPSGSAGAWQRGPAASGVLSV